MYLFLLVRIGHVTLLWQINPKIPVAWCWRLSVYPHCMSMQVGGLVLWGEKGILLQSLKDPGWQRPQGWDITLWEGKGAEPGERVKAISQSWHGSFTGLFCSGLIGQNVMGPCMTSDEGAGKWSLLCAQEGQEETHSNMDTAHTSELASPILEMILSKSSDKFAKMSEQRISSYPWPWP